VTLQIQEAAQFLRSLDERELVRFLVLFSFELTVRARGTYVPGGNELADPKLMRLFNETLHRALEHTYACLAGQSARRTLDVLAGTLLDHSDSNARDQITSVFTYARSRLVRNV